MNTTVTTMTSRDPRTNRDPRTARDPRLRDPRLQNKPSPVSNAASFPPMPQVASSAIPGIPGPETFHGMPPHMMPGMMPSQPPPGLFPSTVMSQLPPGMPPTSSMPFSIPFSQPPPAQKIFSEKLSNQGFGDRVLPIVPQIGDDSEKEKSVEHQRQSVEKGTLRSELERRAKENENEVKHKSDSDSHKQKTKESKSKESSSSKDRRSAESRNRDSKERAKDSRSRRGSPRHDRGSSKESRSRDDEKKKTHVDEDAKKTDEDRKRGSKTKSRSTKSRTEEDSDSKDSRREKDKSPLLKERSRSPVSRKYHSLREKKSPKKIEVIEKVEVKTEVSPEPIESEDKLDVEKKPGLFESGYKIPKKEVAAEETNDLDERQQKTNGNGRDPKLVKVNSKRDLSELAENADKTGEEHEGPSKKPRLDEKPKLDNELR